MKRNHPYRPARGIDGPCAKCGESGEDRWHFAYQCPQCDWSRVRTDTMAQTIAMHRMTMVHVHQGKGSDT